MPDCPIARLPDNLIDRSTDCLIARLQVYEMSLVRHSLMAVGPSGVGKSKIVEALQRALEGCKPGPLVPPMVGQPHREIRLNPESIAAPQTFGSANE